MNNVLVINAHEAYPFSTGQLNASLVQHYVDALADMGKTVQATRMDEEWEASAEVDKHLWADAIIVQSTVNWMGVPWSFKRYKDHVYTAGMDGRLCDGDGRSREMPEKHYGSGGSLAGKPYMLSLTFNAPAEAFDDPDQFLFQGRSVDDLFFPAHMNFRFFGMEPLPTFACYDVMKNPQIAADFERLKTHIETYFGGNAG